MSHTFATGTSSFNVRGQGEPMGGDGTPLGGHGRNRGELGVAVEKTIDLHLDGRV